MDVNYYYGMNYHHNDWSRQKKTLINVIKKIYAIGRVRIFFIRDSILSQNESPTTLQWT